MKICTCTDCAIFETKRMAGNWEQYTGQFRVRVPCENDVIVFELPGRGGRVSQLAAREIHKLWHAGKSAGEISRMTGCQLV